MNLLIIDSQFTNFEYEKRVCLCKTEQQIDKVSKNDLKNKIILYTIVETKLAKYISNGSAKMMFLVLEF